MKRLMVSAAVVISMLGAAGCRKADNTIKIGIAGPMTGGIAKMGEDFRNAVTIAAEEWNAAGGVLGKKVELLIVDDQSDPKQAVSIANKLVNEGVAGVIGHFNSSCSIPASDVYNRAGIPMITPASTNPQLTDRGYRGAFRVCGRDDQQGKVAAEFVNTELGIKKIAIIHDRTTYGQGLADEFRKYLDKGTGVVYYGGIRQGDNDFKAVLTSLRELSPELLYFGGVYTEAALLVKQAGEVGLKVRFMSGDAVIDPKFIEIAGANTAEGAYLTFSPDPVNIPEAKGFISKYKARFGEPGPYAIYSYDALNILLSAVSEAHNINGKSLIDALHNKEFSTSMGRISFTEKGDVAMSPYVMWVVRNGKFEQYR
jgi:branched-chain amino acid transport system substrate-binding protein